MKQAQHIALILATVWLFSCQEDTVTPDVFGTLYGQVLLESDNSAIANATISTNPPTSTVLTDQQGNFSFENLKVGTYTIRAEKSGLVTAIESVTVFEGQQATVVISMSEADEDNLPPSPPSLVQPATGSVAHEISLSLGWSATDDDGDSLTYDVFLFNSNQDPIAVLAEDLEETSLDVDGLKYGTTYFWQVVVKDGKSDPVFGEVWSFSTKDFPVHPFVFSRVIGGKYDVFCAQSAFQYYQLTGNAGSNYRPRISPDGNRIAFISNLLPEAQLFVMNRDGSEPTLVPASISIGGYNYHELDFAWSPDGTKLLFMRYNKLYLVNLDGSGLTLFAELPLPNTFVEVDWTSQGNKIAARTVGLMPYESKILLYSSTGTFLGEAVNDLPGSIGGGMFSIAGDYLLFTHDTTGFEAPDGRQLESHIFLKNLATGDLTDLSISKPAGTNDLDPRFSPDGSKVIFVNTNNVPGSTKEVWLMNLAGLGRTKIFENAEMPDWR